MSDSIHRLTAHMAGSISLRNPIDLEALLLDARYRCEGEDSLTRPIDCLELKDDIPLSSVSIIESASFGAISTPTVNRIKSLGLRTRGDFIRIDTNSSKRLTKIDTMSEFRNASTKYPLLNGVARLAWYFVGDADRVLQLAQETDWIGLMRNEGYGEVREWTVEPAPTNVTSPWIDKGFLLRRLPTSTASQVDADKRPHPMSGPLRPPFWRGADHIDILAPEISHMIAYGKMIARETPALMPQNDGFFG